MFEIKNPPHWGGNIFEKEKKIPKTPEQKILRAADLTELAKDYSTFLKNDKNEECAKYVYNLAHKSNLDRMQRPEIFPTWVFGTSLNEKVVGVAHSQILKDFQKRFAEVYYSDKLENHTGFEINNKLEGKVISVISRFKKDYVGTVQINKTSGTIFVVPDSNKIPVDFYVKGGLKAEDTQKVIVELTKMLTESGQDGNAADC